LAADAVVHDGGTIDRHRDRGDSDLDALPRVLREPAAVGDDRAGQVARLDFPTERKDIGIQARLSTEEADDRLSGCDLVAKLDVIGEGELALGADQLEDPLARLLA